MDTKKINNLENIRINNSEQWVLVRGNNFEAPLIINVQAGPGLPIIPEANKLGKLLNLENDFLVAYWDQRACGKSFVKDIDPATITFPQLTDDLISCTKHLLKKYKKEKAILIGYSIGATISLKASVKNSNLFERIFLVGLDIDIPTANKYAIEFALSKAKQNNKRKLVKQISELSNVQIIETKLFQKRAKILTDLGGIKVGSNYNQLLISTISNMLFSKEYKLRDIPKTIKGMEFCQNALLPELDNLNIFNSIKYTDVPIHFIQGRQDGVAPYHIAERYFEFIKSNKKTFTIFEKSAHMPHYTEPKKFTKLIKETIK